MIGSLHGTIIHQANSWAILETASGVGYRVFVGNQVVQTDQDLRLYIYHHIREDASDLYGFLEVADLTIFELLLTVSGVGPKMAQNLVSTLGRSTIIDAISSNQPAVFRSVSGVGQKVAEKIIVELKNKLGTAAVPILPAQESTELFEALTNFGYKQTEIIETMKSLDPSLSMDQKLKQALRLLAK